MRVDIWLRANKRQKELTSWTIWRWGGVRGGKGPSSAEQQLQQQQANFYQTLTQSYQQQFANQNSILQTLNTSFTPIIQAGPNQYGFNAQEDAALRTQSSEQTSREFANALTTQEESMAAKGGGNDMLPSGAEAAIEANIRGQEASTESGRELGITQAGYQKGAQDYWSAVGAESGVAKAYDPTGYIGGANTAGENAFSSADKVNQEEQAASPWGAIGGALGGIAGAGLSMIPGVGPILGGALKTGLSSIGGALGSAAG